MNSRLGIAVRRSSRSMARSRSDEVMERFLDRLRDDLVSNNMLRGSWVEEIVASFLGIDAFPGQWNYYDLRDANGRTISVKQSVGQKARFDVTGRKNAWDNDLAVQRRVADPKAEGWLSNPDGLPRRWCDVYVFAHLPAPVDVVRVANVDEWRFGARSAAWLDSLPATIRSQSVQQLIYRGVDFVDGTHLRDEVAAALRIVEQEL